MTASRCVARSRSRSCSPPRRVAEPMRRGRRRRSAAAAAARATSRRARRRVLAAADRRGGRRRRCREARAEPRQRGLGGHGRHGDRIRRFGYRTVGEAIAGVAGVYIAGQPARPIGRHPRPPDPGRLQHAASWSWSTARRVNEAWGAFAGVGFDGLVSIDDIARIEVIRGPVSSVYGTNAFFGDHQHRHARRGRGRRARGAGSAVNSINGAVATAGFAAGGVDQQLRGSVLVDEPVRRDLAGRRDQPRSARRPTAATRSSRRSSASYGGSFAQVRAYRAAARLAVRAVRQRSGARSRVRALQHPAPRSRAGTRASCRSG